MVNKDYTLDRQTTPDTRGKRWTEYPFHKEDLERQEKLVGQLPPFQRHERIEIRPDGSSKPSAYAAVSVLAKKREGEFFDRYLEVCPI